MRIKLWFEMQTFLYNVYSSAPRNNTEEKNSYKLFPDGTSFDFFCWGLWKWAYFIARALTKNSQWMSMIISLFQTNIWRAFKDPFYCNILWIIFALMHILSMRIQALGNVTHNGSCNYSILILKLEVLYLRGLLSIPKTLYCKALKACNKCTDKPFLLIL